MINSLPEKEGVFPFNGKNTSVTFVYMIESPTERMCRIMKGSGRIAIIAAVFLTVAATVFTAAAGETVPAETEQGLNELQNLLDMTEVDDKEGLSLEEMTDAFSEAVMSEYFDSASGFSMQYPSVFQFSEEETGDFASTADGRATLRIENNPVQDGLGEDTLKTAILFETPDAVILKNEQNGCLRVDKPAADGKTAETDLYLLTKNSLHRIVITYPAEEKGTYLSYIEYMINTMGTNETDLG